jgi:nitrogen fixation/metabolism regulation signal transduction histidine kinase
MASLFETTSLRQHIVVFFSLITLGVFLLIYGSQFLNLDTDSFLCAVNSTKLNETHSNQETKANQSYIDQPTSVSVTSTPATLSRLSTGLPVHYTDPMDITRNVFYGIFLEKGSKF